MPTEPMTFTIQQRVPGLPDGDYTADFPEAGTTFTIGGAIVTDPIPVERAWIEDGVLYTQGRVTYRSRSS